MAKYTAARFVQHETAQRVVLGDEAALLPQGVTRGRQHATHDHIAHLAFGMGGNHMHRFDRAHL